MHQYASRIVGVACLISFRYCVMQSHGHYWSHR